MSYEIYEKIIQPNDTVIHKPSGEIWVVCGVDYNKGDLIPCGYPLPTLAKLSDCELIEKGYIRYGGQKPEYIEALKKDGLDRFIDVRSAIYYGFI